MAIGWSVRASLEHPGRAVKGYLPESQRYQKDGLMTGLIMPSRRVAVVLAAVVAILATGLTSAQAVPGNQLDPGGSSHVVASRRQHQCVGPTGIDLNEFYGVSEQIVSLACGAEAHAAELWRTTIRWFVAKTFQSFPPGFVPAAASPPEDFVAKFVGIKHVIDRGTRQERTYFFENGGNLWRADAEEDSVLFNTITLGTLKPQHLGEHTLELHLVFNGMHCDGFPHGTVEDNCLGPGDVFFFGFPFKVVRHPR